MLGITGVVHPAYLRTVVLRGLVLWLLCRLVVTGLAAASTGFALALSPLAIMLLVPAVAALAHIDARALRESVFHANLGTPGWLPAAAAALLVLVSEMVVALAVAAAS